MRISPEEAFLIKNSFGEEAATSWGDMPHSQRTRGERILRERWGGALY